MGEADKAGAGHRARLRERFRRSGLAGFHDYEALELLLTYAIPRRDVKPLAKELIKRFGGLKGVFDASIEELTAVKGVGANAAGVLTLIKKAAEGYVAEKASSDGSVRSSSDAAAAARAAGVKAGGLYAIYLSSKNEVQGVEELHPGGPEGWDVKPRAALEKAFKHNARSVIFVRASEEERCAFTRAEKKLVLALKEAASAIDIIVHDHLVVTPTDHKSAKDAGWM